MTDKHIDLVCIGRTTLDLFGNDIGAPFSQQTQFTAYVGGCPANICVAAHRLGLETVMLTGISDDHVGRYIQQFFAMEGIDTGHMLFKPGTLNNLALAALLPPDNVEFVPYHEANADLMLTVEDVERAPIPRSHALVCTGMSFLQDPSRSATEHAIEIANRSETTVFFDADYRPPMWSSPAAYRDAVTPVLQGVDYLIGTEKEICALANHDNPVEGADYLRRFVREAVLLKRGELGCQIYPIGREPKNIPPFPVRSINVLGAGDAFAAGFIYGWRRGGSLASAARLGNACGALIVTEHGTANAMPDLESVLDFIDARGGF